jgi:hypothetical protein
MASRARQCVWRVWQRCAAAWQRRVHSPAITTALSSASASALRGNARLATAATAATSASRRPGAAAASGAAAGLGANAAADASWRRAANGSGGAGAAAERPQARPGPEAVLARAGCSVRIVGGKNDASSARTLPAPSPLAVGSASARRQQLIAWRASAAARASGCGAAAASMECRRVCVALTPHAARAGDCDQSGCCFATHLRRRSSRAATHLANAELTCWTRSRSSRRPSAA